LFWWLPWWIWLLNILVAFEVTMNLFIAIDIGLISFTKYIITMLNWFIYGKLWFVERLHFQLFAIYISCTTIFNYIEMRKGIVGSLIYFKCWNVIVAWIIILLHTSVLITLSINMSNDTRINFRMAILINMLAIKSGWILFWWLFAQWCHIWCSLSPVVTFQIIGFKLRKFRSLNCLSVIMIFGICWLFLRWIINAQYITLTSLWVLYIWFNIFKWLNNMNRPYFCFRILTIHTLLSENLIIPFTWLLFFF